MTSTTRYDLLNVHWTAFTDPQRELEKQFVIRLSFNIVKSVGGAAYIIERQYHYVDAYFESENEFETFAEFKETDKYRDGIDNCKEELQKYGIDIIIQHILLKDAPCYRGGMSKEVWE